MEPKVQVVSHYEILERLGVGGMGVVYKARDLHLDRMVAVKFLHSHIETSESQKERFIREAKAASSLDHPNICTIYEIGFAGEGQLFIAMAYYDGKTLKQKMHRGRLGLEESTDIAMQVAQGLAKAHLNGIFHRDIKPANLMVTNDGVVKILDFGVAKLSGSALTNAGMAVGTVAYMSPEQLAGRTDQRTDLWSLGVVLYEMLAGRHPFEAGEQETTIHQILQQQPPKISGLRPDIPPALEQLIARALEKDRARRYFNAQEMLQDLRRVSARSPSDFAYSTVESAASHTAAARPSIVVLPFANLSREPEAEYFSDGLSEELIYALSQVEGLRVVSRVSAFQFKGQSQNLAQIADQLKVNSIVDGSVRMSGDRLRVNVEMTDVANGFCIWSKRFDREMKDVFAIQDEVASSVVNTLKLKLEDNRTALFIPRYIGPPDAYKLYLKGRYYYTRNTEEAFQKAGECFGQAIALDPSCAPAYAGLADFYLALGFWSVISPKEAWPKTREYATQAMQLDPRLPDPHVSMAKIHQFDDWDRQAAEMEFRHAIQLNPGHSDVHFAYSVFLLQLGLLNEALNEINQAHDLDPLNLSVATGVAWLYYYLGDYHRAVNECQQVLELSADYPEAQGCMALCSEKLGRPAEHVSWFEKAAVTSGGLPFVLGLLGRAYALNGQTEKAREVQTKLGALAKERYTSQVAHALVSIGLGELDCAMQWLEEAFQSHDAFLCYAKVFPPYDPLREQPRFQEMIHRMGVAGSSSSETLAIDSMRSPEGTRT